MYKLLIDKKRETIISVARRHDSKEYFTLNIWKKITFKVQESKLQKLQFQKLHRIVPTNY